MIWGWRCASLFRGWWSSLGTAICSGQSWEGEGTALLQNIVWVLGIRAPGWIFWDSQHESGCGGSHCGFLMPTVPCTAGFPARLERSSAKPKILIRDSSAIQNHAENPPRFTKFSHWHRQHWPPHSWCCMPFVFPLSPSGWWKESRDVHFDGGELLALQQGK